MLAIKITSADGEVGRMNPSPEMRVEGEDDAAFFARIAAQDCPAGSSWEVVEEDQIPAPPAPVPASITRRQCAKQMLVMGLISPTEALAMTRTGAPPAMVATILAQMPADQAVIAEIDFAADTYERGNALLVSLMEATGADVAAIDNFFRAASVL